MRDILMWWFAVMFFIVGVGIGHEFHQLNLGVEAVHDQLVLQNQELQRIANAADRIAAGRVDPAEIERRNQ